MPADFPPWDRVYAFFRRWRDHALVKEFHVRLRGQVRIRLGRDVEPMAGVVDSQSVEADAVVGADSRGFDGAKLINGRKRHVVVDTLGLLLGVMVTAADTGDRTAALVLLEQVAGAHHLLALVWADGGYTGSLVEYCLHQPATRSSSPGRDHRHRHRPHRKEPGLALALASRAKKCSAPKSGSTCAQSAAVNPSASRRTSMSHTSCRSGSLGQRVRGRGHDAVYVLWSMRCSASASWSSAMPRPGPLGSSMWGGENSKGLASRSWERM